MKVVLLVALAFVVLYGAILGGLRLGAGERSTDARVVVTRDFGAKVIGEKGVEKLPSSETAMRLLQREFEVKTRYGGGFVQAIDGLAGGREDGRPVDWFLYVNGILSPVGSLDVELHGGDVTWWDRHAWGSAGETPAVVGSFPEPFAHGQQGRRFPVVLECARDADAACEETSARLADVSEGAARQTLGTGVGARTLRVLVGTWDVLKRDHAVALLAGGPRASGVFARFGADGDTLELLDDSGRPRRTLGAGAGLVAATRFEEQAPTWAITGTDEAGVLAAAKALRARRLRNTYALAVAGERDIALPLRR